jgi:APA family basic amino acid/polyamine antiporter
MAEPANNIRPPIGISDLGIIVVGLVVGIGTFRTPSIVARQAESETVFFLAWVALRVE